MIRIFRNLAILLFCVGVGAHAEVVLETDDNTATLAGTWTQSTSGGNYYGTDYATAQGSGSADTASFFSPRTITSTGNWCVQARWTSSSNRTTAAQYQVYDGTTLRATYTANQQVNGGVWRRLGCVTLSAGKTSEVRLSDTGVGATNVVVADGVRWVWDEAPINKDYCIAVSGGWGNGGTTFVAKNFVTPPKGTCKPWSGMMKTASTVVGTSTGSACLSTDGKLFTASLQTTAPEWLGIGSTASDHIELCPLASSQGCPAHAGETDRGTFGGPAAVKTCTSADSEIPSSHD